jgi:hypothetical protein
MKEINLEEIWQKSLHTCDMYIDYDKRGYDAIIWAMKQACNQCIDLCAKEAKAVMYSGDIMNFPVIDSDSLLQIKEWIK